MGIIFRVFLLLFGTLGGLSMLDAQSTNFSPYILIKLVDEDGNRLANFPLEVNKGGSSTTYRSNPSGEIALTNVKATKILSLTYRSDLGKVQSQSLNPEGNGAVVTLTIKSHISKVNPVSITASVSPRLATDNPYSIQIISKKTIQKMAAQNVTEVLQNQSGVLINQDPSLGSSLQLQGLGGQNVKFLINGVPMIGRLNGNIDISQIPADNIERIEIVEGPMSVVYGTDAIGGVINIITKSPMKQRSSTGFSQFISAVRDNNTETKTGETFSQFPYYRATNINTSAFHNLYRTLGKAQFAAKLDIGRQFFNGIDFDLESRIEDWKPKSRTYGSLELLYSRKKWKQNIRYSDYYEYLIDRSNAEFNLINITGYNNYFHTRRRDLAAITEVKPNDRHSFRFQNAVNVYRREKINVKRNLVTGLETPTRLEDQDTTLNIAYNLRGLWEYQSFSRRFTSLVGYEIQSESLSTQRLKKQDPLLDAALFTSIEYRLIPQLLVKPSIRMAYNKTFGKNPFPNVLGNGFKLAPIIPSLQLKNNLTKHLTLRGSYARGFRAPSAKELYFLFVDINHNVQGNPLLKSEQSDNYNFSIDYRHAITSKVASTFKLSAFFNDIQDEIQLSLINLNTNLYRYINIGRMNSRGISGQTQVYYDNFNVSTSLSYIKNASKVDESTQWQKWNVWQLSGNLSYQFRETQIQWFSRYTSKTLGFLSNGNNYEISGYFMADLSLTQQLLNNKVQVQVGVKNLFNVNQVQNTAPLTGVHSSGGSGLNIAMGRNPFIRCVVNL